jgi:hypothetical protein
MDTTNTVGACFTGNLELDGGGRADLALLGPTNYIGSAGGQGAHRTVWDSVILGNAKYGMFGTPRYNDSVNFLAAAFVNNFFGHLRTEATLDIPMLIGGNQGDGLVIGCLNIKKKDAAILYLYTTSLHCGQIYVSSGVLNTDYVFDLQAAHLTFDEFYCEGDVAAMVYARADSWVKGNVKATSSLRAGKNCLIYSVGSTGGGEITLHERTSDNTTLTGSIDKGVVKLKAVSGSKRVYRVICPNSEATNSPFAMDPNSGTPATTDTLLSVMQEGEARWQPGGTSASPTLTRKVPTYT